MIFRYQAIPIDYVQKGPSFWRRVSNFILFWRKSESSTPAVSVDMVNKTSAMIQEGIVEAPTEQHAIFKLMYSEKLYPVELEQVLKHEKKLAKRLIRLQQSKKDLEKDLD